MQAAALGVGAAGTEPLGRALIGVAGTGGLALAGVVGEAAGLALAVFGVAAALGIAGLALSDRIVDTGAVAGVWLVAGLPCIGGGLLEQADASASVSAAKVCFKLIGSP